MCAAIREHPDTVDWYREKGEANGKRELLNIWNKAEPIEWIEHCQTNDKGQLRSNLANVMTALREAPELHGLLAFDEMQLKGVILRRPPGGIIGGEYPRPLRDDDVTATQSEAPVYLLTSPAMRPEPSRPSPFIRPSAIPRPAS
jgi:hypothetical protein